MAVNGVDSSERNYLNAMNGTSASGKVYNAVFSDSDKDELSVNDFFNMMVTQLTNQDFMNPVDDTQYLAQMAQFSTMQEMMDLCQYSKQNYVMSMLGKEVTVTKTGIGGSVTNVTGKVEKITLDGDDFTLYVDGTPYDISKVTQISEPSSNDSGTEADV
ncbi:MAG: flagellar hook capping FlgD N-terminal domain-containing protein [Porcipelethomonas sp.]